jgi:fructokinase
VTGAVVVAGEALIDLVPAADGRLTPVVGGGPFNTARAVGRLGQPATFIGRISHDAYGRRLAAALEADGVRLPPALRCDLPTSLALAELDVAGRAAYSFYFQGTSAVALSPEDALAALPSEVAALHVGGLGLVLEPLATAVEALVSACAGSALVVVDPNVRPSLMSEPAAYRRRLDRILAQADVVKVSDEDLAFLDPERSPRAAAERLLEAGPKLALLTLGGEGAVALGAFGALTAPAPVVRVVDTIGAGDTFSGAWLARWTQLGRALDDREAVADATAFACRAAALSCTRAGASPPTLAELGGL